MAFVTEDFSGEPLRSTDEISDAGFFFFNNLPDLDDVHIETIKDLFRFQGSIILK
jgi:hypothetical protein